jgi:hypothetical protein
VIRKAVTLLAGLGLVGGAGTVVYNQHGDATVRIKGPNGKVQTVQLKGNGKSFSCPAGTHDTLEPLDIQTGRIELTLRQVRSSEIKLERQYPNGSGAPRAVVLRYNALLRREKNLVAGFNADVSRHNAYIDQNCTPGS